MKKSGNIKTDPLPPRFSLEVYQAFMTGYVRRINDATLRVDIGGVKIGSAKYSRLAQINLQSRIITFSRFAIENVPERGRRYLVIHELAHVKEPGHNRRFWQIVGQHEPNYKQIGRELELAFRRNVNENQAAIGHLQTIIRQADELNLLSGAHSTGPGLLLPDQDNHDLLCGQDDFDIWPGNIMSGGSEPEIVALNGV